MSEQQYAADQLGSEHDEKSEQDAQSLEKLWRAKLQLCWNQASEGRGDQANADSDYEKRESTEYIKC